MLDLSADESPGSDDVPLNGAAPIAALRLSQLVTRENSVLAIAVVIGLDYFGLLSLALAAVPC